MRGKHGGRGLHWLWSSQQVREDLHNWSKSDLPINWYFRPGCWLIIFLHDNSYLAHAPYSSAISNAWADHFKTGQKMLRPPWNHSHRELCHWRWKLGRLQSIHTRNRLEQFPGKIFSLSSKVSFFNKASLWVLSFDWMRYQSLPWSVSRRWEGLCMWENKRFAPSKNPLEIMNSV